MKVLLLVAALTAVVVGRPDIGLELRNKQLANSYGAPSASVTNLNEHSFLPPSASFQTPYLSTSVPFYDGSVTTASPLFQDTVSSTPAPFYGLPSVSTTAAPFISSTPGSLYGAPILRNNFGSSSITSGGLFLNQGAPIFNGPQFPSLQSSQFLPVAPAEVQKHVYFFEAPEEPDVLPPSPIPVEPAKKNVKILFIKAPHYAAPAYRQIPLQPQNQEKTIVYVLVKKPEEQQEIVVPTQPPTVPAKPEVYFIKYKNQEEAEAKVSNTLNEHSSSGANIITSGIDTASIAGGYVGNPYIGNQIISSTEAPYGLLGNQYLSSTESPFGLLGGNNPFVSTSTLAPFIDNNYSIGSDISISNNGINGQYTASTESPILNSTPYTFAPIHPTYGPPAVKK